MEYFRTEYAIDEIVFMDDFFRSSENDLIPSWQNRKFLKALFGTATTRLGWKIREVSPQSLGGEIPLSKIMKCLDLPKSPEGWAAATIADLSGCGLADILNLKPSTLVIGWGMPPSILRLIENSGAAFLDVEIHWARFTRNLHLAVRTNDPMIEHQLEHLRVNEEVMWSAAASLRAYYSRRGSSSFMSKNCHVGIFAGQMSIDLALVQNGMVTNPFEYIDHIAHFAQEVDLLAICPHPAMSDQKQMQELAFAIPNAMLCNANTYNLICSDNISFTASLSSGILKESSYLGCKDTRQLINDDRNNIKYLPTYCSSWIPVHLDLAGIEALGRISSARQNNFPDTTPSDLSKIPRYFPEDTVDQIFGYRWGLNLHTAGLTELPELRRGESIGVAEGQSGALCISFGHGWHPPEQWGAWSAERRAHILVRLDIASIAQNADLELVLSGRAFAPEGEPAPEIDISVNGRGLHLRRSIDHEMEWVIDFERINDLNLLVIAVDVQNAWRPCDMGGHPEDKRCFGFGIREIALRLRDNLDGHLVTSDAHHAGEVAQSDQ